eukprot:TRINITY_DN4252_c0_g1_i2.p1 TRINITY_DN4252_c0_g1~~TRINITY_DN4252_c0_g1_i2.p1  ORF type:complete len:440 (+),score=88.07 TRINITY_DN4252_c0_g1_i2:194-1513(+)
MQPLTMRRLVSVVPTALIAVVVVVVFCCGHAIGVGVKPDEDITALFSDLSRNIDVVEEGVEHSEEDIIVLEEQFDLVERKAAADEGSRVVKCAAYRHWRENENHFIEDTSISYCKVHKSASSTIAGILRRMASLHGLYGSELTTDDTIKNIQKMQNKEQALPKAVVMASHSGGREPVELRHATYDAVGPVRWITSTRDPASRLLSQFYFRMSPKNAEEEEFKGLNWIMKQLPDPVYRFITPPQRHRQYNRDGEPNPNWRPQWPVNKVLSKYDMVLVQERMTESITMMAIEYGFGLNDILFTSSKVADSDGVHFHGKVHTTNPGVAHAQPDVRKFFESEDFKFGAQRDIAIQRKAMEDLTAYIDKQDNVKWRGMLGLYEEILRKASHDCADEVRKNSKNRGKPGEEVHTVDCEWRDEACHMHCLNDLWDKYVVVMDKFCA